MGTVLTWRRAAIGAALGLMLLAMFFGARAYASSSGDSVTVSIRGYSKPTFKALPLWQKTFTGAAAAHMQSVINSTPVWSTFPTRHVINCALDETVVNAPLYIYHFAFYASGVLVESADYNSSGCGWNISVLGVTGSPFDYRADPYVHRVINDVNTASGTGIPVATT